MTADEFKQHLSIFFGELNAMTDTKGVEYANSDDQLANFKRLARELGLTPIQVALVFFTKHVDSIKSAARTHHVHSEPLHGRFIDAALYLVLMDALRVEGERELRAAITILDPNPLPPLRTR